MFKFFGRREQGPMQSPVEANKALQQNKLSDLEKQLYQLRDGSSPYIDSKTSLDYDRQEKLLEQINAARLSLDLPVYANFQEFDNDQSLAENSAVDKRAA